MSFFYFHKLLILRIKTDFLKQLTKKSKIMFLSEKEIFDTRFDTKKYFVTMRSRFSLRSEKNKDGKSLLYLDISDKLTRPRLKTSIYIEKKYWDPIKQRVKL